MDRFELRSYFEEQVKFYSDCLWDMDATDDTEEVERLQVFWLVKLEAIYAKHPDTKPRIK